MGCDNTTVVSTAVCLYARAAVCMAIIGFLAYTHAVVCDVICSDVCRLVILIAEVRNYINPEIAKSIHYSKYKSD